MNTLQTGIAVALAVLVVGVVLVFPNFSPFGGMNQTAAVTQGTTDATPSLDSFDTTSPSMPTTAGELQIIDEKVGTGETVAPGDSISVNYVGMLDNGTVFDASANHGGPADFVIGVGQVIPGWDKGIVGMKEGGKRKLIIPAALAYGAQGVQSGGTTVIPPNATLTFEVEIVKVTHHAE